MFVFQALSNFMAKKNDLELDSLEENLELLDFSKLGSKEVKEIIDQINDKLVEQYLNDFPMFQRNFNYLKSKDLLNILKGKFLKCFTLVSPPGATRANPFIKEIILSDTSDNQTQVSWLKNTFQHGNRELTIWLLQATKVDLSSVFYMLRNVLNTSDSDLELAQLLKEHGAPFYDIPSDRIEYFLQWEEAQKQMKSKPIVKSESSNVEYDYSLIEKRGNVLKN